MWLKRVLIFITVFMVYHIGFGSNVFLVSENNRLLASGWYAPLGLALSFGISWFLTRKKITKNKQKDSFRDFTPQKPKHTYYALTEKEQAEQDLEFAKDYANEANRATTVLDFVISVKGAKRSLENLAWFNEKKKMFMYPTPRDNFYQMCDNMENTIRDFINRAVIQIKMYGTDPISEIRQLIWEIEHDNFFADFMTEEIKQQIKCIEPPEFKRKEVFYIESETPETKDLNKKYIPIKDRDPLEVIKLIEQRFETQYQFAYKRLFNLHDCQKIYEQTVAEFNDIELPLAAQVRFEQLCVEYKEKFNITNPFVVIDGMEGHAFEEWCAELLRRNGYIDVKVTPGSGDQGVDVIATKEGIRYAIQCKCYSSDLSNKPVQEVNAGKAMYRCQIGVVMTNRHFTSGAKELAEANGVLLWDREKIEEMIRAAKNKEED